MADRGRNYCLTAAALSILCAASVLALPAQQVRTLVRESQREEFFRHEGMVFHALWDRHALLGLAGLGLTDGMSRF